MNIIRSPWLAQLKPKDEPHVVFENRTSDVSIIGAGIAGITTAYFLLKNTDKKIIIVESGRVAHGATGHNAGQIVSYFERQISDLVQEFGLELTAQAQNAIDSAWNLLEHIYQDANLETPYSVFTGYAGCQDLEETLVHLENNMYASLAKINMEPLMIAKDSDVAKQIPEKYKGLYSLCPHEDILSLLETEDTNYIAAISARKGVMNSALFCEELLDYLYITYPDRFTLFEGSHVDEVVLQPDDTILKVKGYEIRSGCVVLCTNGFEKFKITNTVGADIDTKFHHLVQGSVGYMAGYLEEHTKSPIAISYLPKKSHTGNSQFDADPYFYLTRRTYEVEPNKTHSLICVGGPEARMDDTNDYSREHPYPDEAQGVIDEFLRKTYVHAPKGEIDYVYKWHGLMGYTPNGVRLIGPEPINPILMYNLGCNGVGILPSIYGAHKIAQFVNKEELGPSIFDVKDQRNL